MPKVNRPVKSIKHFTMWEIHEAYDWAKAGGMALHTHNVIVNEKTAPKCFVNAVRRGENIAHLFDLNKDRLVTTARALGVNVIYIDNEDTPYQHIDLCGAPLKRAMEYCNA